MSNAVAHVSFFVASFFFFPPGSLIYEKLGEKAFGWPGKCGVFISVTMQNIGGKGKKFYRKKFSNLRSFLRNISAFSPLLG